MRFLANTSGDYGIESLVLELGNASPLVGPQEIGDKEYVLRERKEMSFKGDSR